jgi:hypothetical protein
MNTRYILFINHNYHYVSYHLTLAKVKWQLSFGCISTNYHLINEIMMKTAICAFADQKNNDFSFFH